MHLHHPIQQFHLLCRIWRKNVHYPPIHFLVKRINYSVYCRVNFEPLLYLSLSLLLLLLPRRILQESHLSIVSHLSVHLSLFLAWITKSFYNTISYNTRPCYGIAEKTFNIQNTKNPLKQRKKILSNILKHNNYNIVTPQ